MTSISLEGLEGGDFPILALTLPGTRQTAPISSYRSFSSNLSDEDLLMQQEREDPFYTGSYK